jgi:hypothetical protein
MAFFMNMKREHMRQYVEWNMNTIRARLYLALRGDQSHPIHSKLLEHAYR